MCGIAGIVDYKGKATGRPVIEAMLCAMNHRGPDESGVYLSSLAALGKDRKSVV